MSVKNAGAWVRSPRTRWCSAPLGGGDSVRPVAGGPMAEASSRKYSATRPERASAPAPTQTSSPLAQSESSHECE